MVEPKLYSKYNDLQRSDNLFVLDKFFRLVKWNHDESVLDVGFGDGKFVVENLIPRLPKNFRKFVGCDISEAMVKFAKETHKHANLDFVQLDISAESIPLGFEMEFDHIFSFYTLHWVAKQRQAFTNMYKMLKPGGDMLLTFLANNPIYDIYQSMSGNIKWQPYMKKEYIGPYHGIKEPEKDLEKLLTETGFVSHVCHVERRIFVFPNLDIFEKSIIAVNPIIPQLPPDEVSNYVNDFIQHVRKLKGVSIENVNNNNEEAVHTQHELFIVFASKPMEKN